jgi:hypothetical protein
MKDPLVEEIRATRQRHATRFGNNLKRIFEDLRIREKTSERKIVSRQPAKYLKTAQ